jgi:hypothetical protein
VSFARHRCYAGQSTLNRDSTQNPFLGQAWVNECYRLISTVNFRFTRHSGAMRRSYLQASMEIFDQHDVAFESINTGVDDHSPIGRDIKTGCGFGRSADVQHPEASLFVRG